jgi:pyruvate dehydrogenase E2 component (dihydrolipoamide acetyltransferase)
MANEIKLEALKEGVESVEVNAVKVAPGDTVSEGQTLLEVQADKAALDVVAPQAGRVVKVLVKPNETIKIGQAYIVLEPADGSAPASKPAAEREKPVAHEEAAARVHEAVEEPLSHETPAIAAAAKAEVGNGQRKPASPAPPRTAPASGKIPLAGPATRRLARELGVDLSLVDGQGRNGRITEEDVKGYVRALNNGGLTPSSGATVATPKLPDFSKFGAVEAQPLTKVRRLTAQQMALAWTTIPHVTQHDLVDVTDLEAFRKAQKGDGPKLTVTAFALKACAIALKEFPTVNASLDLSSNQLILKRYVHIGVAVDTPGGLLVPVIRDVDRKSIHDLAAELNDTAEKARTGKASMEGGSFTITNLGGIGGTGFTPIVNWPEVAILGLSRSRLEPSWRDGGVVPRLMLPLSFSYDHRVIDGALAARFTRRVAEMLENPLVMLLHA